MHRNHLYPNGLDIVLAYFTALKSDAKLLTNSLITKCFSL